MKNITNSLKLKLNIYRISDLDHLSLSNRSNLSLSNRSDEGQTLETSAFKLFTVANLRNQLN